MKNRSTITTWNDMPYDILVKIFMVLDILDLVAGVSRVCSGWRAACYEPTLWRKIDLSVVRPDSVEIPDSDLYEDESNYKLLLIIKNALKFGRGKVSCLIFQYYVSLRNEHLVCAAERTLNLKRLVLPVWNRIDIEAFEYAIMFWTELESLTVPCVYAPCSMMRAIGSYCKNFTELKLMCPFDYDFAKAIVSHTPQLKVLSLRCTVVFREALIHLLQNMQHLEALNLSHCLLVSNIIGAGNLVVYRCIDDDLIAHASRLKNFLTCDMMTCPMCRIAVNEDDFLRWYDHELGNWRLDEIPSLTV